MTDTRSRNPSSTRNRETGYVVGVDAGGTNYDAVLADTHSGSVVETAKVPSSSSEPLETLLGELLEPRIDVGRVVVSTTLVLNAAVQDRLPDCTSVLVPGVGLPPDRAFYADENVVAEGCVDHRVRLTEEVGITRDRFEEVNGAETVAVTAKFGGRNPEPETRLREALETEHVASGNEVGRGSFPRRAATTVLNARSKPVLSEFDEDLREALNTAGVEAPVFYLKGDAAMLSRDSALSSPTVTVRAGPASSTLGLLSLTGVDEAVCVDVGGTTTDVTLVTGGYPCLDDGYEVELEGVGTPTVYEAVESVDLPLGGDTRMTDEGLTRNREGDAAAFGGPYPTLTDALHVVGDLSEGDGSRAYGAVEGLAGEVEDTARNALEEYTSQVADAVRETAGTLEEPPREVVVGGALAPSLAPRIGSRLEGFDEVTVPEHSGVAGAVGCAAARVSVTTDVRIDSPRGEMTVGSVGAEKVERVDKGRRFSDEEVEELVRDEARRAAERAGGERDDEAPTEVLELGRFNVVEGSRVVGEVVDATAQVEPGYRRLSGGDEVNE